MLYNAPASHQSTLIILFVNLDWSEYVKNTEYVFHKKRDFAVGTTSNSHLFRGRSKNSVPLCLKLLQPAALSTFGKLHFIHANSNFKDLFGDIIYCRRFAGS